MDLFFSYCFEYSESLSFLLFVGGVEELTQNPE